MELAWDALVTLMALVPAEEPTVRGAIRSVDGDDQSRRYRVSVRSNEDPLPVFAGLGTGDSCRVWRDGQNVRMERPDGTPSLIVGGHLCWSFGQDRVVVSPRRAVRYGGHGSGLLWHIGADRLVGEYGRRPLGAVESTSFLDRPAWRVRVGPPPGKDFESTWVIDAGTGLQLADYNETLGSLDQWTQFVVGEQLAPELFSYDGPAITDEELRQAGEAKHEQDMAGRRDWFERQVTALPLRLELDVTVLVNSWDDETGAFHATLGNGTFGSLARRPRSDQPWELSWSEPGHRWSDDHWDWAVVTYQDDLTPQGLAALQRQLGNG